MRITFCTIYTLKNAVLIVTKIFFSRVLNDWRRTDLENK